MNLTVSGVRNGIQVRRSGVLAHLQCHSAIIRISVPDQPAIDVHAVFTAAPNPCWLIGVKGKAAAEVVASSEYSVTIDDSTAVEVITDDGLDRTELF